MSEPVVTEQPDLSALTGSPGSKRKRDPNSPTLQRAKRAAPPANMAASAGDTAAYIESAIQATEAAAANGVNVADFNALQQAAQEGTEAADPASATSTAQAALGMYPTLHIPPSTEEQFAAQAAAEASEHANENSMGTPDVSQQPAQQQPQQQGNQPQQPQHPDGIVDTSSAPVPQDQQLGSNGAGGPQRYSAGSPASSKPTVGSEEWHKMRKDNHKEGEIPMMRAYLGTGQLLTPDFSGTSAP